MTALVEGTCKYNDYSTCLAQIPDTTMFVSVVDAFHHRPSPLPRSTVELPSSPIRGSLRASPQVFWPLPTEDKPEGPLVDIPGSRLSPACLGGAGVPTYIFPVLLREENWEFQRVRDPLSPPDYPLNLLE